MSDTKYTMTLSLNVLNHLGINLYSNIPAVLSEIVANSWDADAQNVQIDLNFENDEIVITDDGCGMDEDDINQKFLMIGYNKRKNHDEKSNTYERPYMGRKGIGKLSMFSIAKEIEIISKKNEKLNALQMNVDAIVSAIENSAGDQTYHPKALRVDDASLPCTGTKIILRKLKRNISSLTPEYIRKRVARRFSIIGKKYNFQVFVNSEPVSIKDRDYYSKLDYIWYYGDESSVFASYAKNVSHKETRSNELQCKGKTFAISGWIGTVGSAGDLKDGAENLNKIVILVRGKLGQEDILADYSEGGLYSKYLIGEIHADFFDDGEDMATSNRQEYRRDDERYIALKSFIHKELKYIQGKWTDLRNESGVEDAKKLLPVLENWYTTLQGDDQKYAKQMLGKVNQIISDSSKKIEILKYSILAFEKLRHIHRLSEIEKLRPNDLEAIEHVFNGLDELEATLYYQIVKDRLEVIEKFRSAVSDNTKEKLIQKYLFDHLWLLDPSWERVAGTEYMETTVLNAMNSIYDKLSEPEKAGRLDLGYRVTSGKHLIIELKRPERVVSYGELMGQINKYSNAMRKVLQQHQDAALFEIICVLGKPVGNDDDSVLRRQIEDSLRPLHARVVYYSELIENAYRSYLAYINANREAQPLIEIMNQLDIDMDA